MDEIKKKFVTEEELEDRRQKRQEEWERVRQPGQPLEAPEEPVDNRSLFERLEEQRARKQDEYDETHRLRNMVKGLENDEVEFLDFVSRRQEEINEERELEEKMLLHEYKNAVTKIPGGSEKAKATQHKKPVPSSSSGNSQKRLLAGVVKRKSTDSNETDSKRRKSSSDDAGPSQKCTILAQGDSSSESLSLSAKQNGLRSDMLVEKQPQTAQVIGILPGLGVYSDSDSDDDSSSVSSGFDESAASMDGLKVKATQCQQDRG